MAFTLSDALDFREDEAIIITGQVVTCSKCQQLVEEYRDVFETLPQGLPPLRRIGHTINTGDHPPVSRPLYRLSPKEKEVIDQKALISELDAALEQATANESRLRTERDTADGVTSRLMVLLERLNVVPNITDPSVEERRRDL